MNTTNTTTVIAPDIVCDGCANAIRTALGRVPGVSSVAVDIDTKKVTVQHDGQVAPRTVLTQALDKAGFPIRE